MCNLFFDFREFYAMMEKIEEVSKLAKCVIFCAGGFSGLAESIQKEDFVIAADGGLTHTEALGIVPRMILGDFDSLDYTPQGAQVFPAEKDDTDAMLAARAGLEAGCREFVIYGGLEGPRLEHTVANYQTLQYLADRGVKAWLVGKNQMVTVLKNGTIQFPNTAAGYLSLFCMGPDASGITLQGFKYTLTDGSLTAGFPLGVSNQFVGKAASITVKNGSLLVIYDRCNGFAGRTDNE